MITHVLELHELRALFLTDGDFTFVVGNPARKNESVIYITDDPALGKLDLTITNNTANPIKVGTESLLKIFPVPPLAKADLPRIKVSPDWKLTEKGTYLELRATSPVTIASKGAITIHFADVMASSQPGTNFILFEYSRFEGIANGSRRSPQIFVQRPPKSERIPLGVELEARPEYAGQQAKTIYITPWEIQLPKTGIANHVFLQILNPDKAIPKDSKLDSKIVVSFTSGNSDLSVCLDEQIKVVSCSMKQAPPAGKWDISKDSSGVVPIWTMRPPKGGDNVFDKGGLIAFRFDSIVSQLPPGPASPMFIQFANIPGYNDSYMGVGLQKIEAVPYLRSFDAYSGTKKLPKDPTVGYKEKITLKWDVFAAERVRILETKEAFDPVKSTDVFPLASPVTYTLAPEIGDESRGEWRKALSLRVSAPIVERFEASPDAIAPTWPSELKWICSNGSHCTLTGPGVKEENLPLIGGFKVAVADTSTYTLTCAGVGSTSASVTIRVPPPEVKFTIDARVRPEKDCIITWSTKFANQCQVRFYGVQISNQLHGVFKVFPDPIPSFGVPFAVFAYGKGRAGKDVKITPSNRFIEVHDP